jgi:hypothetical protein
MWPSPEKLDQVCAAFQEQPCFAIKDVERLDRRERITADRHHELLERIEGLTQCGVSKNTTPASSASQR